MKYSKCTSSIKFKGDTVEKTVTKYIDYDVFRREIYWLNLFNKHKIDFTPKIININDTDRSYTMSFCGFPITKKSLPTNWINQVEFILSKLSELNCRHNDIKVDEILVLDEKIFLCDFGWASLGNDFSLGIGLNSRTKPYGVCKNDKIYEIILAL